MVRVDFPVVEYVWCMKLTSALFGAFLKCPTKSYLRSTGQSGSGNAYADWVREQNDAGRKGGVQWLVPAGGHTNILFQ
jgi:CRISPR/Cas system-associated exonuclease Cas4 (RecB family)